MRFVVLGAGAIGTLYGAKLATAYDVTLVGRRDHVDRIRADGVHITGLEETTYRVDAVTELPRIEDDTVIVLTTKVTGTRAAIEPVAPSLRADTTILCLQNGLHSERLVTAVVGDRCLVVRGITHFGATFVSPGRVALKAIGHTVIAPSERSDAIAAALSATGLDGRVSNAIDEEIWRKLIFNCVVNPLTAVGRIDVGSVADERLDPVKQLIIDECLDVARREGVRFGDDFLAVINETFRPSRNLSSMHQDLLRGRPTEIDYLNGAVVALGREHGIECPVNASLVAIVKALEARRHVSV